MKFIKKIENNTIVVTNYNYRLEILKELDKSDKLLNVNFMTLEELLDKYYFSYDERAIYYLMDKYKLKRDIAGIYLKNMIYVSDKDYNNDKLNKLVLLKKELIKEKLLIYDELFLKYIKNKKIVFYNYNYFTSLEKEMIKELGQITSVLVVDKEYSNNEHTIYEFNDIDDEVEFVAISILKLIEKGVPISLIKLTNLNDDYLDTVKRIFNMCGLKVSFSNDKVISTKVAQDYLSLEGSIFERIDILSSKYKNNLVLDQIIKIVNKYVGFKNLDVIKEMIKYDLKNCSLKEDKYKNSIEIIDYKNYPTSDKYIFMLSFNQNNIPVVYKDEEFITDNIKDDLFIYSVTLRNKLERESSINNILNIKNLVITYKNSTSFGSYYPSNLIDDLGFSVKEINRDYKKSYSLILDRIKLSKMLDNYIKTGSIDKNLNYLYSNYNDISYSKYDNKFKGINSSLFKDYISGEFNLSYSSMDSFYKCPFRYYLSYVLNLDIYEERFETYIGKLFHYVLENGLKEKKDVAFLVSLFISNKERVLSKKEKFFVNNLIKELEFVLKVIFEQLENTNLNKMLFEEKVEIKKEGNISVTFKGFIDKVMYEEKDGKVIGAIIDYKTGFTDINLGYVPYGLSMQLPIYLYLAKNSDKLKDISFAGFYLQRVLSNEVSVDIKKSYDELKRDNVLLYGYSNSNESLLYEFDKTYKKSKYIKSMKLNDKGGFSRFSKILSDDKIDKLIKLTDERIDNAIREISVAHFDIKPKKTDKELLGCKYCNYRDICFKEALDEELIVLDKDLSFLGGDINA